MQEQKNKKNAALGRPRISPLSAREQARLRKKRQRAKLAQNAVSKIEVLVPSSLKSALKKASGGKPLSEVGAQALRLWLRSHNK